jgi:hypothetical protein
MTDKSSEYYSAAEQSMHVFFLWFLEKVSEEMKKRKMSFGYCSLLTNMLQDLDVIANAAKAKKLDLFKSIVPLSGITFTRNDGLPKQGCNDVLYKFDSLSDKPAYLGTLTMINSSPQIGIGQSAISFILADNEDDGLLAMNNYYEMRRELCRTRCEVSSFLGEQIDDFEQKKWTDLHLPSKALSAIKLEVSDFFRAEKYYETHKLRYRRGMALVGPRGNGKTTACHVIASTAGVPVIYGSALQLTNEEVASVLLRTIGYNAPCIVVIEDLDMVVPTEDSEPLIILLSMLEKISNTEGIFLIGTINSEVVESGVFRPGLFDTYFFFQNIAAEERKAMFDRILGKFWRAIPKQDRENVVNRLDGCSGAVVQEVISRAILNSNAAPTLKNITNAMEEILNAAGKNFGSPIGY